MKTFPFPLESQTMSPPDTGMDKEFGRTIEQLQRNKLLNDVAVGVYRKGKISVLYAGTFAGATSQFEIGSLTKSYTAELLAHLVVSGTLN